MELTVNDIKTENSTQTAHEENIVLLIQKAEELLRLLSAEHLQSAIDFISYLYEQERLKATEELEAIPGFVEGFERAKQQVINNDVIRFEDVRRNV